MTRDQALLVAINKVRDAERERCAKIAERLSDQGRDGHQIAKVIRAGMRISKAESKLMCDHQRKQDK